MPICFSRSMLVFVPTAPQPPWAFWGSLTHTGKPEPARTLNAAGCTRIDSIFQRMPLQRNMQWPTCKNYCTAPAAPTAFGWQVEAKSCRVQNKPCCFCTLSACLGLGLLKSHSRAALMPVERQPRLPSDGLQLCFPPVNKDSRRPLPALRVAAHASEGRAVGRVESGTSAPHTQEGEMVAKAAWLQFYQSSRGHSPLDLLPSCSAG